jgi:hypothetical protein
MKTSELTGAALDWAVMKAEGPDSFAANVYYDGDTPVCVDDQIDVPEMWQPSTYWAQGGPIIERERIEITPWGPYGEWRARDFYEPSPGVPCAEQYGPTPMIAAMRCYVASKLGDTVDIPEELT